jgi:tRNA G46 methylase TrmB
VAARLARLGVPRVRTLQADATHVLAIVPAASVHAYHVYFPDPWPKRRHGWRRIFSPEFVRALARTLVDGGELYVATDVGAYMTTIRATIIASGTFVDLVPGDDHPGLDTAFARKYRVEGRILHLARFARRIRSDDALGGTPQPCPANAASKISSS